MTTYPTIAQALLLGAASFATTVLLLYVDIVSTTGA